MRSRFLCVLIGAVAGSFVGCVLQMMGAPTVISAQGGLFGALLVTLYAAHLGKAPAFEELNTPVTLYEGLERRPGEGDESA